MTFRITELSQLEHVSPSVRKQLEKQLDAGALSSPHRGHPEEAAGALLIQWIDLYHVEHPALGRVRVGDYLAHNANGGGRTGVEGAIFQGQGVRKGWPDYTLYLPWGDFKGAVLELKAPSAAKPDDAQLAILSRLERAGYRAFVAWGFDEARAAIEGYFA